MYSVWVILFRDLAVPGDTFVAASLSLDAARTYLKETVQPGVQPVWEYESELAYSLSGTKKDDLYIIRQEELH